MTRGSPNLICDDDYQCHCLSYEALSYEWGDDDRRYQVTLNGQAFPITRNLQQALFHIRDQSHSRILWIDAICINQKDADEKSKQVHQMDCVYGNATQVIAWLGLSFQNSNLAFDFAQKLYKHACTALCSSENIVRGDDDELQIGLEPLHYESWLLIGDSIKRSFMHSFDAREWLALHRLFKRQYWARAWIFQEAILAKRLLFVCGLETMTWGIMQLAMIVTRQNCDQVTEFINSSIPIPDQGTLSPVTKENPHHFSLIYSERLLGLTEGRNYIKHHQRVESASTTTERWLELIHVRLSTLPHDLIYSILGLIPLSVANAMPRPDYKQPVQEIFKQFVRAFVIGTESLNIICYSHHTDTQDDLPLWVLDWRREARLAAVHDFTGYIGTRSHRRWHASALRRYVPVFANDMSTMSVYGVIHGVVTHTKLEHDLLARLQKIEVNVQEVDVYGNSKSHHTSHVRQWWQFEDDARALLGDAACDSPLLQDDQAGTLLQMLLLKRDTKHIFDSSSLKQTSSRWTKPNNFNDVYAAMLSTTKCRTASETDKEDIILGPMWTQPKDIICQLFGCTAAVVLREVDDGMYQFIGDCYVLGKMGGAAIEILEQAEKKKKVQKFIMV